jgi:hypothetical protein
MNEVKSLQNQKQIPTFRHTSHNLLGAHYTQVHIGK